MQQNSLAAGSGRHLDAAPELKEVVMGLHWAPTQQESACAPDLDAVCLLLDSEYRALEVVHPGHPRNADGSVVHTGDSRTGSSEWDDERIFVFLPALPAAVCGVAFVVHSASERPFSEVNGASCHISDHATEYQWVNAELTELHGQTSHFVALLKRSAEGWEILTDANAIPGDRREALMALATAHKSRPS